MLLTITTTHEPASDLGYLLHKNPARWQSFGLSFGKAHVFYPEVTSTRTTAALLLDVDSVGLVRAPGNSVPLEQYVNDRAYAATSFLSVALAQVFGSALAGKSKDRPELAAARLPLTATIASLPCHGGAETLGRLFEPLGYTVDVVQHTLDDAYPQWGSSRYHTATLSANCRLMDLLRHIYVLIPVLDGAKHYWVGSDEVDKLLRQGEGWLSQHPERDFITNRYLKYKRSLAREAFARLAAVEERATDDAEEATEAPEPEQSLRLNEQRLGAVVAVLRSSGARRVLDLGCGEGRLMRELLALPQFTEVAGLDVSVRALEIASDRLRLDQLPAAQRERVRLLHGSLMYRDQRLAGYDAAAVVEVIEHMDAPRLRAFERVLFEFAQPRTVVVTTPNREYNVTWETLPAGAVRHRDHRFEWTREEFRAWAIAQAGRFGYSVRFLPVGPEDPVLGAPTQMGVFHRA